MRDTKAVGERSEGMILAALLRAKKVVLQPFGDNQRYDLVIDEDGKFIRVQCKTGRIYNGAIKFGACSTLRGGKRRNYLGEADLFGIYCPSTDKVYLVPVSEVGQTDVLLRIEAPKNGQKSGVRMASDYELK